MDRKEPILQILNLVFKKDIFKNYIHMWASKICFIVS